MQQVSGDCVFVTSIQLHRQGHSNKAHRFNCDVSYTKETTLADYGGLSLIISSPDDDKQIPTVM